MIDMNRVTLMGRLGANPVCRTSKTGKNYCTFSLATSQRYRTHADDGMEGSEFKELTQWHKIVAWGRLSEICSQYLTKGSTAYVEGMLKPRKFQTERGEERSVYEIQAEDIRFFGPVKRSDLMRESSVQKFEPVEDSFAEVSDTLN